MDAKLKSKPVDHGIIYVTESELKDYIKFLIEKRSAIYTEEELQKQKNDMLNNRVPVTFHNYEVRAQGGEDQS